MHLADAISAVRHGSTDRSTKLRSIGVAVMPIVNVSQVGVVTARFQHSAYLEFNNEWLCLALFDLGAGPTVLQLSATETRLHDAIQVGASVNFDGVRYIKIDDYCVDTDGANPYSGLVTATQSNYRQQIQRWTPFFQHAPMSIGFAPLLYQLSLCQLRFDEHATNTSVAIRLLDQVDGNELLAYAAPKINALLDWVHRCALLSCDTNPPGHIVRLLGAGPGLTPSGDDFLAGVLCALQLTGAGSVSRKLSLLLLANLEQYTTPVSASLLKQAAQGRVNEHAHKLIQQLLFRSEVDHRVVLQCIQRMGASSGWDFLAGLVLGILAYDV